LKPLAAVLLVVLGLVPAVTSDSFVYRVCFTTDRADTDVVMREADKKADADMCAWVVTCESAEVHVMLDKNAKRSFWRANSPERCR